MIVATDLSRQWLQRSASAALCLLLTSACSGEPTANSTVPVEPAPTAEPAAIQRTAVPAIAAVSSAIEAAVANPARPAADVAPDADRKPAQTLTFYGVEPSDEVFEFVAGGGYYTELLSRVVGDSGHVTATRVAPERIADGRLPNVTAADDGDWGLAPDSVDLIFTALNYHDVINLKVERAPLLANMLAALKPGGIFAVIDHSAESGSGVRDVGTLHRVEESIVVTEVEAAGFELVETTDLLRNPADARTLAVFDPAIRGKTDCFMLKFRKPPTS
jgi:predicted methyltransferase